MKIQLLLSLWMTTLLFACKSEVRNGDAGSGIPARSAADTLKWVDHRIGEPPPVGYYDAWDSIIKKWDIRYERIQGGCELIPEEKQRYEKDNPAYFRLLEHKYGKDWRSRFDAEVRALDSLMQSGTGGKRTLPAASVP